MYKHILIPTDGSDCSEIAVVQGLALAKALKASVSFLYAVEDPMHTLAAPEVMQYAPELYSSAKQAAEDTLKLKLKMAADAGVLAEKILAERKSPADAILAAEKDHDLVVIATHGRRGFNRIIFGSVAEAVIRRTTVPCLVIRNPKVTEENSN